MSILTEPKHEGGGRRPLAVALIAVAALVAAAIALWLLARRPAEAPKGPPPAPRARTSPAPRATATPTPAPEARATPRPRAEPRPEAAAPTLRVDADVPGANVFLDRKFLGTTPVETRDFEPGPHRLNVSAEGYEMYGESVELAAGPNEVVVRFKAVRLDEQRGRRAQARRRLLPGPARRHARPACASRPRRRATRSRRPSPPSSRCRWTT